MVIDRETAKIVEQHPGTKESKSKPQPEAGTKIKQSELLTLVNKVWELGKDNARYYNSKRYLNMYFLMGEQWVRFDATTQKVTRTDKKRDTDVRLVFNHLFPYYKRQMSLLGRAQPLPLVLPSFDTPESRELAEASQRVATYKYQHLNLKLVLFDLIQWFTVCNDAFLKVTWDTEKEVLDEESNTMIALGDVGVHVLSPFEVFYYPLSATKMSEVQMILHAKRRKVDYCEARWPERAKNLTAIKSADGTYFDQHIANFMQLSPVSGVDRKTAKAKDDVWVLELTIKQSKRYPNGLVVWVAGEKFMDAVDNPYIEDGVRENSFYNFVYFPETKVPGRFWATSAFEQGIPIQKEYNAERTLVIQNAKDMCNLKWLVDLMSTVERITDQPGEIISARFNPLGNKPVEQIQPKPLPGFLVRLSDKTKEDMQDILAYHEVSKAQTPANIESGRGVIALQQKDEEIAATTGMAFLEGIKRMYQLILNRVHKYCEDTRQARMVGEDKKVEFFEFRDSDIEDFNVDLYIANEASFMEVPAAREEKIMARFQQGLYGDPADPRVRQRVRKMVETVSDADDFEKLDEQYAKMENQLLMDADEPVAPEGWDKLAKGKNPPPPLWLLMVGEEYLIPTSYDNDPVHEEVHAKFIKENKFKEGVSQAKLGRVIFHHTMTTMNMAMKAGVLASAQAPEPMGMPSGPSKPPAKPPAGGGGPPAGVME